MHPGKDAFRVFGSVSRKIIRVTTVSVLPQTSEESAKGARAMIDYAIIEPITAIADDLIITLASIAGAFVYHTILLSPFMDIKTDVGVGLVAALFYSLSAYHSGLYRIQRLFRRTHDHQQILASWAFALLVLAVILFLLKVGGTVSRGSIICFAAIGGIGLVLWRRLLKRQLRRAVKTGAVRGRRAIVLGDVNELAEFAKYDLLALFGIHEVERISLPRDIGRGGASAAVEGAIERARDDSVGELVVAMQWADSARLDLLRSRLRISPLPVRLLPDRAVSAILALETGRLTELPLVEIQRAPLSIVERVVKRNLDIAIAALGLLVLSPLLALIALAVKLDSNGPVLFRQRRRGFNGKEFVIKKFRTMSVLEDGASILQAKKHDPRVTRIGRLLRRTSIDELPQLFNVINGNMSLIGPRPHALAHDDEYGQMIANYAFRHHVKPGMSGWAQVNGCRGETPTVYHMAKRIEFDLWYINNWSVGLDLRILLRTCLEVLRRGNAF
jgi:Undecaprenyl-phosphate glucose phosphotransferase